METLQNIIKEIENDSRNKAYTERGIHPLLQVHPQAKVLIIGQAPGQKTEAAGRLFQDASGERLMDWMGVDASVFYGGQIAVLPMDFYFPGKGKSGDKAPRAFIYETYHQRLLQLMPDVKLTLLIGQYAVKRYLKDKMKRNLTETVRAYREYLPEVMPLVHPSPLNFRWQAKNPWFAEAVIPALKARVAEVLK
ncbi:uracil-DNA glycosylase family protein [Pseudoramibacter sp.]|jgi:uracil-DNA glycosylase|uniref:uracil-DNA glycosylase family protein n=1 Tax=Pseudoramibacter sp. TaxID=2034862 RepID=UPI0025F75025|nr:uracil-DNA glycosylase family protein [Pseudoramibacter sp.]MCH4073036.1 uracil-DNA glycosylase family protein [Pseudoramibacter sp.]MCH4106807.1 uracil-DNA glycosylase family protein [Pseudoramibacter sp.]